MTAPSSTNPTPNPTNLLLPKGMVFFNRFLDGTTTRTGWRPLGNVEKMSLNITDEIKDKYSSMDHTAGLLQAVPARRTCEVKMEGAEFSVENLAMVGMGAVSPFTQSGASVSAELITSAPILGCWYDLVYRNVSAVVVKAGVAGTTVMTLNTDYTVDAVRGMIYIVPTGAIATTDLVKVDYTYSAVNVNQIVWATKAVVAGALLYKGDPMAGPVFETEIWHAQISPDTDFEMIGDDFAKWGVKGRILSDAQNPTHSTMPYWRSLYLGQQ